MPRYSHKPLLHLLLIALLFATQALVLAHEAGHAPSADSGSCFVCLHATPYKAALPGAGAMPPPAASPPEQLFQPAPLRVAAVAPDTVRARGPPGSSRIS